MWACLDQIKIDAERGHTLKTFIHKFAPEFENDTKLYIAQVASDLGVASTTKLTSIHPGKLARAMVKKESSTIITP
jgi:hypothetical protein